MTTIQNDQAPVDTASNILSRYLPDWSWPLVGGLTVTAPTIYFYVQAGLESDHIHLPIPTPNEVTRTMGLPALSEELVARFTWWASASAYVAVLITAIVVSIYVIHKSLAGMKAPIRRGLCGAICVICIAVFACFFMAKSLVGPHVFKDYFYVLKTAEGSPDASIPAHSHSQGDTPHEQNQKKGGEKTNTLWGNMERVANLLLGLTSVALILVTLACSATLVGLDPTPAANSKGVKISSTDAHAMAPRLASRKELLTLLIYVCALALIVGVFEIYALHRWPAHHFEGSMNQEAFDRFAASFAAACGFFFSLLLAGIYLPASIALRIRSVNLLPPEVKSKEQREKWMEQNSHQGLFASTRQQFSRVVMILGPMLVGLLWNLLEVVKQ